jgi:D-sedoheptulose 7-phosphate isomerase
MDKPACHSAEKIAGDYAVRLSRLLTATDWSVIVPLAEELLECWRTGKQVFWVGNGGSAGNATHLANDFLYPISKRRGSGVRVHALTANVSIITCLANDEGYDDVFGMQLSVLANPGDVLIAFSGSGNSPNILRALEEAKAIGMKSFAVLGFSGGKAKALADHPIHFAVDDMQISEDMQLIVGHMVMQYLYANRDR